MLYGPKTSSGWGSGVLLRGPQGPKGDKGNKGNPGNANIMYSKWLSFKWGKFSGYYWNMSVTDQHINSDFMNKGGIVLVYGKYSNPGTEYFLLPYTFNLPFASDFKKAHIEIFYLSKRA